MLYICTVNLLQTYINPMKIPNKTLLKWKSLKEEGDITSIAVLLKKAESTVHQIFRTGIAKVDDAEKINTFYRTRQSKMKSIKMEDDNN
jgi:hypothetical protein